MRVVAGRWRGRRLASPRGDAVRPTTDRVKEAMFSILGPRVQDAEVLDLCCGSGGLGIEALSRGARRVDFVDQDRRSLLLVGRNLELCGAEPGTYALVPADAERHLGEHLPRLARGEDPWVLLSDPPYGTPLAAALLQTLLGTVPGRGFRMAIIEHGDPKLVPESREGPWRIRNRRYGKTILTVLERG